MTDPTKDLESVELREESWRQYHQAIDRINRTTDREMADTPKRSTMKHVTQRIKSAESLHGPISNFILRSKPLKPNSHLSGDGVYWWNGRHGFNAFGGTVFYTEKDAVAFRDIAMKAAEGTPL
tara:strand:- start:2141 stop:2509 length:369 start_codon:yes stop_codon:yes gene_type:complete